MIALGVNGLVQTFADEVPLQGHVFYIVKTGGFIHRPRHGTMVDDDVAVGTRKAIQSVVFRGLSVAVSKAEVANDDIIGRDIRGKIGNANTLAGRGLPGDGDVGLPEYKSRLELDDS